MRSTPYDVVVVGGGPAGAMAAWSAARAGARVVLVERESLPRYKLCGGGLIGLSLSALPPGFSPPVLNEARTVSFTYDLGDESTRDAGQTVIPMIMRSDFDNRLLDFAAAAGAEIRPGVTVTGIDQSHGEFASVETSKGTLHARAVVGADGSASRAARYVGATFAQVDLGLEVELAADEATTTDWAGRVLLDFGRVAGGYAWVFPKGDRLTVGAIAAKGRASEQRAYVADLLKRFGLQALPVLHEGGHLTRCRTQDSPVARDRVLLAGDAAGLLEPWTREGISFALRSGSLAGAAAADIAAGDVAAGRRYAAEVDVGMGEEMALGFRALRAYERHPRAFYRLLAQTPLGWKAFVRLARGETTLARAGRHRAVRAGLRSLGG